MLRRTFVTLVLSSLVITWQSARGGESLPPASEWVPGDALAALEIARPTPLLDLLLSRELSDRIAATPTYQKQAAKADFRQFLAIVRFVENQLHTDWRSALRKLSGGGVTVAVVPNGGVLLAVDSEDPKMLDQLHELFLTFARADANKKGQSDRVASTEYAGVTQWTLGNGEAHAIIGRRLLFSNRAETLKAALDLRGGKGKGVASSAGYRAARKAAEPQAAATMYVDMAALTRNRALKESLKGAEPLPALVLAGVLEPLRDSKWLAATLDAHGHSLRLRVTADGPAAGRQGLASFAWPTAPGDGVLPNLAVPRRVAAATLYRDLHAFYASKDKLFPERTAGLMFFENMMGIFFTGRDLTEEVMAETKPQVRLVVAQQAYDPAIGTPQVQIPAFALVLRLRNPEKSGEMTEEAWQKAVGLMNFTRGQKALPGLIIDRDTCEGTRFTLGYFSAQQEKQKTALPVRFNFRPAIARYDDSLVLSSTDGLAKDILAALRQEKQGPPCPRDAGGVVDLDGPQLGAILEANHKALVEQNMVEKGMTQEQAEAQVDQLLTVVKTLGQAHFELVNRQGRAAATLELNLAL